MNTTDIDRRHLGVVVGVVLIVGVILFLHFQQPQEPEPEPRMVDENLSAGFRLYDDGTVSVADDALINDSGYVIGNGSIQLIEGPYGHVFENYVVYNGNSAWSGEYPPDDGSMMRTARTIDPDNGVIEGYMAVSLVGSQTLPVLKVTAFVDQEFREAVGNMSFMVIDPNTGDVKRKPYTFDTVADGVYRDVLYVEDTRRFRMGVDSDSRAMVFVGDVGRQYNGSYVKPGGTAMYLE